MSTNDGLQREVYEDALWPQAPDPTLSVITEAAQLRMENKGLRDALALVWSIAATSMEKHATLDAKLDDARLIAAAPDLLEALEMLADAERDRIADGGEGFMTTIARAKVSMALTKARGT